MKLTRTLFMLVFIVSLLITPKVANAVPPAYIRVTHTSPVAIKFEVSSGEKEYKLKIQPREAKVFPFLSRQTYKITAEKKHGVKLSDIQCTGSNGFSIISKNIKTRTVEFFGAFGADCTFIYEPKASNSILGTD